MIGFFAAHRPNRPPKAKGELKVAGAIILLEIVPSADGALRIQFQRTQFIPPLVHNLVLRVRIAGK